MRPVPHLALRSFAFAATLLMIGGATGCAAESETENDDSIDLDAMEDEEVSSTSESEQALTTKGCQLTAFRHFGHGYLYGIATIQCVSDRVVVAGVCIDERVWGTWYSRGCTGARSLDLQPSVGTGFARTTQINFRKYSSGRTYRVRFKADGYGTATTARFVAP